MSDRTNERRHASAHRLPQPPVASLEAALEDARERYRIDGPLLAQATQRRRVADLQQQIIALLRHEAQALVTINDLLVGTLGPRWWEETSIARDRSEMSA